MVIRHPRPAARARDRKGPRRGDCVPRPRLRYSEAQQKEILDHFIAGGSLTAGGIRHAVTSAAQVQEDGDAAWDLETSALDATSRRGALIRS